MVLGAWVLFIVAVSAAQLPTKFSDAENNEASSYLPGKAESTKALAASKKISGGESATIVVIYHRDDGLTAADKAHVAADRAALNQLHLKRTSPFDAAVFSKDGNAAILTADIRGNGKSETIQDPVEKVRDHVTGDHGGLVVKVTGPAGYSADAIKVFDSINGTLLLAAVALVFVLLALIYRSPIFLWIPLISVLFAEITTRAIGYGLTELGVTVNGQSSSILSVLVLGAGTDYALLLVARYREELRKHEDKHEAVALAVQAASPAIVASGLTVMAGLLCLSVAQLNGTAGLGPIAAMGVGVAVITMLTLLPALLAITGRRAFWPFVPRLGGAGADETHGIWRRVGESVAHHPRRTAGGAIALLLVMALGLLNYSNGLTQANGFRDDVESVEGQKLLAESFPSGRTAPTDVIVPDPAKVPAVRRAVQSAPGVDSVIVVDRGPTGVLLNAFLKPDPYATSSYDLIPGIRRAAKQAGGNAVLVGGATAVERDVRVSATRDTRVIVPLILIVVFLILLVLLRAVLAPAILIGTVILSFAAAMGVGAVVFDVIFGFPGSDPSLPLFAFVFLVALGIDYNIFLMARVREETLQRGTRQGMLRALAVTGGVITSAGIVLAGTFSVLAVLPLVFLTEIGFIIAFGVLLDTFLVRSLLVPALVFELGPRIWWPSTLAHAIDHRRSREPLTGPPEPEPAGATGSTGSGRAPTA